MALLEIPSNCQIRHCPNCLAPLNEFTFVLVDIVFKNQIQKSERLKQAA